MKWAWNQLVHIGDYDNPQFTGSSFPNHQWFHENLKPEMTGKPYISLENHWFPTDFPETHAFRGQSTTRGGAVHLSIGRSPTLHHFSNGYHLIPSTTVISWRNFRWNHGCGMDQRQLWNTNGSCIGSYWIILDHIGYLFHIPSLFHMVIASDCPSYGLPKRAPGLCRYRSQVVAVSEDYHVEELYVCRKGCAQRKQLVSCLSRWYNPHWNSRVCIESYIYIYMYSHTFVQIISIYMYMNVSVSFVSKNHSKNLDDSFLAMWWDILCLRKSHQILRLSALRQFNRAKYGKWPIHLCHLSH